MKNKRAAWAAALAAAVLGGAPSARAQGWKGDANILLAEKNLDGDDWGPTDRQGEIGVMTNWQGPQWPVALAADLLAARREESIDEGRFTEQRARTTEFDVGVRKIWRPDPRLRPYAGGGLALASGHLEKTGPFGTISDDDGGAGVWLDGGVFWTLSEAFNLGLDVRLSHADVHLLGADRNAGGFHVGLAAGYHWGG